MRLPKQAPTLDSLLNQERDLRSIIEAASGPTVNGKYLHWDELRRRKPPNGISHEDWWTGIKLSRMTGRKALPVPDKSGRPFTYVLTGEALAMLHRVDRQASGRVDVPEPIVSEPTRDRYLVSSLMEEAISSSLLEGAATTRREAKQMLRSGRQPRSKGEQMVLNNYRTMQMIREALEDPLSLELILEIHRQVTHDTLDDPSAAGRIQTPEDTRVWVGDDHDEVTFHRPPDAEDLPDRLDLLVKFANDIDGQPFVHPVIRAIILHFWLAYDHPFVDGNGRTARALFYRSMLRQGYWLTEFVSISRLIQSAPTQYGRAFLHTEHDENDLTYFILHQLTVLCRAIDELYEYLERKSGEVRRLERLLRRSEGFNHRQLELLSHALRHPDAEFTIASHRRSHRVVYQTARTDLLDLEDKGLLQKVKVGKSYVFYPEDDLEARLRLIGDAA